MKGVIIHRFIKIDGQNIPKLDYSIVASGNIVYKIKEAIDKIENKAKKKWEQ